MISIVIENTLSEQSRRFKRAIAVIAFDDAVRADGLAQSEGLV
jgi:hypothetical protein